MSVAASLFYSSNSDDETLHRRITPTDDQFDTQQQRWNDLADHLQADMRKKAGYPVRTWLQGSYKFATQVRPARKGDEFDIDLGLYFEWAGEPDDGAHGPENLRALVQGSLKVYARDNPEVREVAPPKPRCCRIHYKEDFHVDVPCYHLDAKRDARSLATGIGWEESDPKAFYQWFKDAFDQAERARVRRQVRYVKAWAALKFKVDDGRPSSVVLTTLVAEAFQGLTEDEQTSMDDELLHLVLGRIRTRLAKSMKVGNPVDPEENMNRLSQAQAETFKDAIRQFHETAESAVGAEDEITAADTWTQAFEHFFPMPSVEAARLDESRGMLTKAHAVTTTHDQLPDILVNAVARANPKFTYEGVNRIGPIPKECSITFRVKDAGWLAPGTTVEWMARNHGAEAELENDMGHRGKSGTTWTDASAYVGTHHMDVVFRRNGRLVGMRRVPVTVSGTPVAKRNPPKPSYVRLLGRR